MPPMPFPMPPLFNTAVKDICAIETFEKLPNILFSEVYTVNISALQHYCFLHLQLICLYMKLLVSKRVTCVLFC